MPKRRRARTSRSVDPVEGPGASQPGRAGPAASGEQSNQVRLEQLARRADQPLPERSRFEQALGMDLGDVRVLAGGEAVASALDAAGADAVSLQGSLLFRDPSPELDQVGHEVVHWAQKFGQPTSDTVGAEGSAGVGLEAEARDLGARAARGEPVQVQGSAPAGLAQLDPRDTVQEQRDKRDKDSGASGNGSQRAAFIDHDDQAPELQHDHGFLDDGSGNIDESKREEATWGDHLERAKWIAKLEIAEALRPDLADGTAAYRHFLFGGGATRTLDYERFLVDDSAGQVIEGSLMDDAQQAAMEKHDTMLAGSAPTPGTTTFRMRTEPFGVGNDGRYPYPSTENWQKAIGAHQLWMEMDVTVEVSELSRTDPPGVTPGSAPVCTPEGDTVIVYGRSFSIDLTVHMEDMYNFNPGAADIATGTPDAANGRFEVTGLGQEYLNTATFSRQLEFDAAMDPVAAPGSGTGLPEADTGRSPRAGRRPDGARRVNPGIR